MSSKSIFWFRRDLRLIDNHGLFQALTQNKAVFPIFIFDSNIIESLERNDHRLLFISKQLDLINLELKKRNSSLTIFKGNPTKIFKKICDNIDIDKVYWNKDYEPYAIKRDKEVIDLLNKKNIQSLSYKDQVIFEENEVVKNDGSPYVVYTPYSKKWIEKLNHIHLKHYKSESFLNKIKPLESELKTENVFDSQQSKIVPPNINFSNKVIANYERDRNIPALNATSKLGLYLRFGTNSIRSLVKKSNSSKNKTFLKELVWREFFMQILWHFPETKDKCFKSKYEKIQWRNN